MNRHRRGQPTRRHLYGAFRYFRFGPISLRLFSFTKIRREGRRRNDADESFCYSIHRRTHHSTEGRLCQLRCLTVVTVRGIHLMLGIIRIS